MFEWYEKERTHGGIGTDLVGRVQAEIRPTWEAVDTLRTVRS